MNLIQTPANPRNWGLTTLIPGVGGRLGVSVNKIVIHWMDGTLASTDSIFQSATLTNRRCSHFGVEDDTVHQYVSVNNVAWHAGNWAANLSSVGIEFSAEPGRDASDSSYESGGQLIANLWKQLNMAPASNTLHKHSEYMATQCPGTMDLNRLFITAQNYYNNTVAVHVADVQVPTYKTCHVTGKDGVYLRTSPHVLLTNHSIKNGEWDKIPLGGACDYSSAIISDTVDGIDIWLVKPDGLYCWAGATDYNPTHEA